MIEVEVFGGGSGAEGSSSRGRAAAAGLPSVKEVRRLCTLAAEAAGFRDGHIAVEFVKTARIAELNHKHRGREGPTDVLAFPIDGVLEAGGGAIPGRGQAPQGWAELGDVVICPEHTVDVREAIVHGVLHLVGMDHEADEGEMLARQRELLALGGS